MEHLPPDEETPHAKPKPGSVNRANSMPGRRPFRVTLLLWLVLSLSAWGLLRFAAALRWWNVLYENEARLSPLYLSITGAGWAAAGIVLLWSIFTIKRWVYKAIPIAMLLWLLEYWIERIFFEGQRSNLAFAIVTSLLAILFTWIIAFHRTTRKFLTKSEEHEQPEEHSASS
jgi:hypothetical protein